METTVIMGIYNAELTVKSAVESMFLQSYQDFNMIVCDDGSTDSTIEVLKECKNMYGQRFLLLHNKTNQGLSKTLNYCLSFAQGIFIARMDADDYSLPLRLEKQTEFLRNHKGVDFVGCIAKVFDETGVYAELNYKLYPTKYDLLFNSRFIHPSVVMRKDILVEMGGYNEQAYCQRCEDYDLWLRMYANGCRGANLQEYLFNYYEGRENLIKRKYRYRINEMRVRYRGFKANGMLLKGILFVLKPLVLGVIPLKMLNKIKWSNKGAMSLDK